MKNYNELAGRTEVKQELMHKQYPVKVFEHMLKMAISSAQFLDLFKKHFFYNRPIDPDKFSHMLSFMVQQARILVEETSDKALKCDYTHEAVREFTKDDLPSLRLLHAGLGIMTEAGELLENLEKEQIDWVNVLEENGDVDWYQAILYNLAQDLKLGIDEEVVRERNIAKLKKRYGDKYSDVRANERDLTTERKILEGDK
jgi:hypothetical protein